ncbi:HlyD family type I secretion periplasmic adaptor subunit [Hyphococcus flavus]|uniref:Membrane fusion protein (MFP) family protein n=1 Tax=Hyphococcus flavus TaxID=1866326 RepID=A0AAE9ZGD5_9PROT|nr:HlyD family type I secretion periplasmic adaptor subunit [Hyphococcus flavus]WDI32463.1 HlyD family type I secretion periplasmic adaptor subunit [Hyphococcus flavus]
MNEAVTARPASASFFIKLGIGVIAALFGGSLLWSIAAPIDGAVIASGQIVVETNRKAVQHLEGGVIDEILVQEGDFVEAGRVVARLEDTVQSANLALIDSQLTELYARRARLETERDGAASLIEPRGVEVVLNSTAFQSKLVGQRQLLEARQSTRLTQINLLQERVVQQNERIRGLEAQISSLRDQRSLIEEELAGVRELHEQGYAPKTRVRELERASRRLEGERGALRAGVAEATSIIAEAKLEIERLRETGREEAISELRDVEVSISELEERRVTAEEALRRTEVRAPQAGRVIGLSVHTEGGVIAPGDGLMEIVPFGDKLQVAARVAPQDVDKVQAGQETLVRFSAFGARATPEATGQVKTVSADSFVDEPTGASYYLVLVDIPQGEDLENLLNGAALVPGMPVEAFIRTGSRPAISYFLKPLTDSLARSMRED